MDENLKQELLVGEWNSKYRVGQPVALRMDNGTVIETVTRGEAAVCGSTAVCWFEGIRGFYDLSRATPL